MKFDLIKSEEFKYDLKNKRDMTLFGAFSSADSVSFLLEMSSADENSETGKITSVSMIIHKDAWNSGNAVYHVIDLCELEASDSTRKFKVDIKFPELLELWDGDVGLFYYHYLVKTEDGDVTIGGEGVQELCVIRNGIGERQLLVYKDGYSTSEKFRRGVIYHIFVDRFKRSGQCDVKKGAELNEDWDNGIPQYGEYPGAEVANNVFFGGDLYGIAEELDYIASLGVKTIYLSPVFDAYSNHKYDTGDYLSVDMMFGGDKALKNLCRKARRYGIEIILDGVFNHTGSDSIYFNKNGNYHSVGAYQSQKSQYYSWYSFRHYPDDYECWWGVKILPRVNSGNKKFSSFICDKVLGKWMKNGVSGWRLDVADELDENFLRDFRLSVKQNNPDGVIIGEVWEDASDKVSYGRRRSYICGEQLDSVMNYPLRSAIIDYVKNGNAGLLRKNTEGLYRRYPKCASDNLMNFLGTHDTERILTVFGGDEAGEKTNEELSKIRMTPEQREKGKTLLKTAYGILAGLPGSPCVFYGDEVGLEGYRDPFCRLPFPWKNMDEELLGFYRAIGGIRCDNTVFCGGIFRIIHLDGGIFVYERSPYDGGENYKIVVCAVREGSYTLKLGGENAENLINGTFGGEFRAACGEVLYLKCPVETEIAVTEN